MPKAKHERNAAFLKDWSSAPHGQRVAVAVRYGYKSVESAKVCAHRIRTYGTGRSRPLKKHVDTNRQA